MTDRQEIRMFSNLKRAAALAGALLTAFPGSTSAQAQSRGQLLYSTHCISCHTTEIHWRDQKVATDWVSLKFQVRRWQGTAGLGWSEGDIDEVTRYLNESIYRYAPIAKPASRDMPRSLGHRTPAHMASAGNVCSRTDPRVSLAQSSLSSPCESPK